MTQSHLNVPEWLGVDDGMLSGRCRDGLGYYSYARVQRARPADWHEPKLATSMLTYLAPQKMECRLYFRNFLLLMIWMQKK